MIEPIRLTNYEEQICAWVGKARYADAIKHHRDVGLGGSRDDPTPTNHIRGARCEYGCALMTNLYWRPTIGELPKFDVGGLLQVKSTVLPTGRLVVERERLVNH